MANEDKGPASSAETPDEDLIGPKRPSHTIDLEAKEVDPADEDADGELDGDGEHEADGAEDDTLAIDEPPPRTQPSELRGFVTHLAAGLLGGLIGVLGVGYGLDKLPYSNLISGPPEPAIDQAALDARFAQVASKIAALPKPEPVGGLKGDLATLAERVAAAERRAKAIEESIVAESASAKENTDRVARVEKQLSAQAGFPDAIKERVARLEETLKSLSAAAQEGAGGDVAQAAALAKQMDDRLAALRKDLESRVAEQAEALAAKAGDAASGPDLEALKAEDAALKTQTDKLTAALSDAKGELTQRIAKLETQLGSVAKRQKQIGGDARGTALVIGFANLKSAIDRGQPFAAELEALQELAPDTQKLEALKAHAAGGVRTFAQLERDFPAAIGAALEAAPAPDTDTVIGQLLHNARGLVRVRRTEPAKGDGTRSTLARMETGLKSGDLAAALNEAEALKAAPKAAMKGWLDGVRHRLAVNRDLAGLKSQLIGGLGAKKSDGG